MLPPNSHVDGQLAGPPEMVLKGPAIIRDFVSQFYGIVGVAIKGQSEQQVSQIEPRVAAGETGIGIKRVAAGGAIDAGTGRSDQPIVEPSLDAVTAHGLVDARGEIMRSLRVIGPIARVAQCV